jgi:putative endonuclease
MYYTYILEILSYPNEHYIGYTAALKSRLKDHNNGKCPHTSKFRPWKVKLYVAFENEKLDSRFEKYLKSASGHAFANRHFWNC